MTLLDAEVAVGLPWESPLGRVDARPVEPERDLALLHRWVTHPRSRFWGMQGWSTEQVREELEGIAASTHHDAWLLDLDGEPIALAETYDPERSPLQGRYDVEDGDLGMHVLVAPPRTPRTGTTDVVMTAVMRWCLRDPRVQRVVVEPDATNDAILAKNLRAGFRSRGLVQLPDKTALLSVATRTDFADSALARQFLRGRPSPAPHLNREAMSAAQRDLVTKALRELVHERLIRPEHVDGRWRVDTGTTTYDFAASAHPLEHLAIDPASVRRLGPDGAELDLDAQALVLELRSALGIPGDLVDIYLEEVASTLQAAAWMHDQRQPSAAELVEADAQTIERSMTGHPSFIATNGRIGFGLDDYAAYAPEAGRPFSPFWVAVRKTDSRLSLGEGLDEDAFYARELGPDHDRFRALLRESGRDPEEFRFMPVHPWQWQHKLAITYAPAVARGELVPLGEGRDRYQAQQSIRTLFNLDHPERSFVKLALSVQNMGFLRGLSARYMAATPAINDWVHELVEGDADLREVGFSVLREHAAIGWTGGVHAQLDPSSAYAKMTAALWRESPVPRLQPGERLATMASLLHVDRQRESLAAQLIRASGCAPAQWLGDYLRAYLRPVLHCLLAHDLAFMPHGENLILVLREHRVVRVIMKDIGEEVMVMSDRPLPEAVARIRQPADREEREMAIFTDVFDGFLRHLGATLSQAGVIDDDAFWEVVAGVVRDHRADHPRLHEGFDFFRAQFSHSCLNRLQLRNTRQMVDLTDQSGSLIHVGPIANPIAGRG